MTTTTISRSTTAQENRETYRSYYQKLPKNFRDSLEIDIKANGLDLRTGEGSSQAVELARNVYMEYLLNSPSIPVIPSDVEEIRRSLGDWDFTCPIQEGAYWGVFTTEGGHTYVCWVNHEPGEPTYVTGWNVDRRIR